MPRRRAPNRSPAILSGRRNLGGALGPTQGALGLKALDRVVRGEDDEREAHDVRHCVSKEHNPQTTRAAENRNTHTHTNQTPDGPGTGNTRKTKHCLPDACDVQQPKGTEGEAPADTTSSTY